MHPTFLGHATYYHESWIHTNKWMVATKSGKKSQNRPKQVPSMKIRMPQYNNVSTTLLSPWNVKWHINNVSNWQADEPTMQYMLHWILICVLFNKGGGSMDNILYVQKNGKSFIYRVGNEKLNLFGFNSNYPTSNYRVIIWWFSDSLCCFCSRHFNIFVIFQGFYVPQLATDVDVV